MYILHITAELTPIAKVGGLADVVMGLCRELCWKGHDIDIIMPKYDCMDSNDVRDLSIVESNLLSYYEGEYHPNTIWMGWVENVKVYFLDVRHPRFFFKRGCIYGCEDDLERYLYFSRCAIEFIQKKLLQPDIIHLHDWQTAAIAPLYRQLFALRGSDKPRMVLTIHNIEYQGKCRSSDLEKIGLDGAVAESDEQMRDPSDKSLVNILKGGVVHADWITTVSPSYAKEVMRGIHSYGLEGLMNSHSKKFSGILNGVDYSYWNPEIDRYLPAHFSSRELPDARRNCDTLDKKAYLKKLLRERLNLEETHRPLVGCVSRLVPQKGVELIEQALHYIPKKRGQIVLLGSSPIAAIDEKFHALKIKFEQNPHVHIDLHHHEELAHLIYAASDIFIVPSIFEPCGLTQMIALKYGAIPIVRKTGGLSDTIIDIDDPMKSRVGCGYLFEEPHSEAFNAAIDRAISCWFDTPKRWRQLVIDGMEIDFSWNHPADAYLAGYASLIKKSEVAL